MAIKISNEEWLAELSKLGQENKKNDGFLTFREIVKKTGICESGLIRILHNFSDKGLLIVKKVQSKNLFGDSVMTPVYKIKSKK